MSATLEQKIDKILEKLEKTSVDIAILNSTIMYQKEKTDDNNRKIDNLKAQLNELENDVIELKQSVKVAKWGVGIVISAIGSIILFIANSIFDFFK